MSESEPNDKKWTAQATSKLLSALNRADELGGEVRDYLQGKIANDPTYVAARNKVAPLLGRTPPQSQPPARPAAAASATAAPATAATAAAPAAPAPPAATETKPKGFGDPAIKAQIYGKRSCPWTGRAMTLLERRKV